LETVKVFAVDGGNEAASNETEKDARGKVVFAEAVAEFEIFVKHGAERKGYRLYQS
jgi:hypothetical protein